MRPTGTMLLRIARVLFNDHVLQTAVLPTIADLQREVEEAGADRATRLRALWRGYVAFWTLALVAPLAAMMLAAPPAPEAGRGAFDGWYARHPSFVPERGEAPTGRGPQINFSSTGVAGNVGGLIRI